MRFELREPGCSACLAMNDDKVPAGKLAVSTSNRNFEGRQGPVREQYSPDRLWQPLRQSQELSPIPANFNNEEEL